MRRNTSYCAIIAANASDEPVRVVERGHVHMEAFEVVVLVVVIRIVMRAAGSEIALCGRAEPEQHCAGKAAAARTSRTPGRSSGRTRRSTAGQSGRANRSALFSTTRSAAPSCSSNSSSSGLSWSSAGSATRCASTAAGALANSPSRTAAASTTATTPSTVTRVRISGHLNAFNSGFGRASPEVSITMCSGGGTRAEQALHGRHEIVGDGAADAAVGQLDDVVLGTGAIAAAEQQLAVDADLAELVDDQRDAAAAGVAQEVLDQAGLAGAEEAR